MLLKGVTTLLLILGVGLILAWPSVVAGNAGRTPREALNIMTIYVSVLLASMVAAGICAIVIMRRAKEEYRREARENMKRLVEATRGDAHDRSR